MNTPWKTRAIKSAFLLLLASPFLLKMIYVDLFIHRYTGQRFFGAVQVLANDAVIYAVILSLFYLSYLNRTKHLAAVGLRVSAMLVLLVYAVDFVVITNFNTHLVLTDFLKYASYAPSYLRQILDVRVLALLVAIIGATALSLPFVFSKQKIDRRAAHGYAWAAIATLLTLSCFSAFDHKQYVHSWIYTNVFAHNRTIRSEARTYSDDFIRSFHFEEEVHHRVTIPTQPNMILLMVESLSSYQSKFFSGLNDWTPNLDRIAAENMAYTNFYANGFTTEDAEVALLTGRLPIYPPSSYTSGGGVSFNGFYDVKDSLANILNRQDYATEFLTTADLEFADTGNWAKSVGFDHIEGHTHPYYDSWDRYHFDAVPDEALYHRVLDRVEQNRDNRFFIFVKTVSTHHPFINPTNQRRSEAETFQYADRQLGQFYQQLADTGFFDNGILVIVGDHHAMVPLRNDEIELLGVFRAAARVPLVVVDGLREHAVEGNPYQQIDVCNSLKGLVSGTQRYSDWKGDVLGRTSPKYIAHRRGDRRHVVSVFLQDSESQVLLNGDDSRVITAEPADPDTRDHIVGKINSVRISPTGESPGH